MANMRGSISKTGKVLRRRSSAVFPDRNCPGDGSPITGRGAMPAKPASPWLARGWDHWYIPVRDAEMVEMAPPLTADGSVNPVYRGAQCYRYPPLFLAHIRNGRLLGSDGVVLTADGRVLEESTFAWELPPAEWPVFSRLRISRRSSKSRGRC